MPAGDTHGQTRPLGIPSAAVSTPPQGPPAPAGADPEGEPAHPPRRGLPARDQLAPPALSAPSGGATCLRGRGLGGAAGQGLPGPARPPTPSSGAAPGSCRGRGRAAGTVGGGGAGSGRGGQARQVPLRPPKAPRLPQPRPAGALTASPGPGWGRAHRPRTAVPGWSGAARPRQLPAAGQEVSSARRPSAATRAEPQGRRHGPSAAGAVPPVAATAAPDPVPAAASCFRPASP